eukprot:13212167-Alexandrium_andersonii.AAC.1
MRVCSVSPCACACEGGSGLLGVFNCLHACMLQRVALQHACISSVPDAYQRRNNSGVPEAY